MNVESMQAAAHSPADSNFDGFGASPADSEFSSVDSLHFSMEAKLLSRIRIVFDGFEAYFNGVEASFTNSNRL